MKDNPDYDLLLAIIGTLLLGLLIGSVATMALEQAARDARQDWRVER